MIVRASPASLAKSEKWLLDAVLIETFPMIVTGYVSSAAEGLAPTEIDTGASDALAFRMRGRQAARYAGLRTLAK